MWNWPEWTSSVIYYPAGLTLMQHCFMLHSNRHKYRLWQPDMKQASAAAVHGQVYAEVRGKYTAGVYDSDMNRVYLTGFCVHTDFPFRPLSEPGCWPSEGLKARQTRLSCFCGVSYRLRFGQTSSSYIKVLNLYYQKSRTLLIMNSN